MGRSEEKSTRLTKHVEAPRSRVYRALIDPAAVARWKVPTGMTSQIHAFEAREGGHFRASLTYDAPTQSVMALPERLPPSLSPAENELGWRSSLEKLRELVESAGSE